MISGITLANAGLGVVHGFASTIGGYYDIPHGVICGTLMGEVTRANVNKLLKKGGSSDALNKYSRIGKLFTGKTGTRRKQHSLDLADLIDQWIEEMKIPRLGHYGVQLADARKIAAQTGLKQNPVKLSEEDLIEIINHRI
jgi:alcohol dehydrogenase class IV